MGNNKKKDPLIQPIEQIINFPKQPGKGNNDKLIQLIATRIRNKALKKKEKQNINQRSNTKLAKKCS